MTDETNLHIPEGELYQENPNHKELTKTIGGTAVSTVEGPSDAAPSSLEMAWPIPPASALAQAEAKKLEDAKQAEHAETIKVLEKDTFKLGNLNPLIHAPDLTRKESVDAVRHTVLQKIEQYGGFMPKVLESTIAIDPESKKQGLRFIARFEIPKLTEKQLVALETLVKETYGISVRTRTDSKGNDVPPQNYPPTQPGEEIKSKTGGWYMGPGVLPTTSLHEGLFLFKDQGPINKSNFLKDGRSYSKYIVEIREAGKYQTDLVTFITQVAVVLGQKKVLDRGQLLYETYYDLIRLGLKGADAESIYGMDDAADMIRRELVTPLASPDISRGIGEEPQSVLMIGVPGTGKTLIVERLLQEETGLFVLPIDPFELQNELKKPKEQQYLMPRIAEIARITNKQVVLHVDDIENMVGEVEDTNSTLLNLMAGVQESGFYIIASTNYPEKINPALIQPQRFSVLIHCGLQKKQARYEILKIHAAMESTRLGKSLFESEEIRDIILQEVARHTEGFTPRYLSNIATIAKSHLIHRVAQEKQKTIGLTEEDLANYTFTVEDWEKAFTEVKAKYDSRAVKERDQELQNFVRKHTFQSVGFNPSGGEVARIFTRAISEKIVAARARLALPDVVVVKDTKE